jgi:hypothetical protein
MAIRTRAQLDALTPRSRTAWELSLRTISLAREEHLTIRTAARRLGVGVPTVEKYAGRAIEKDTFGRLVPTKADRLYRRMPVIHPDGRVDAIDVRGSRKASKLGEYWNAAKKFGKSGDESALQPFAGVRVGGVELPTDPGTVQDALELYEPDFDSIYDLQAA